MYIRILTDKKIFSALIDINFIYKFSCLIPMLRILFPEYILRKLTLVTDFLY